MNLSWLYNFDVSKYNNYSSVRISGILDIFNGYEFIKDSLEQYHLVYNTNYTMIDFFNITDSVRIEGTLIKIDSTKIDMNNSKNYFANNYYYHFTTENIKDKLPKYPINIGMRKVWSVSNENRQKITVELYSAELIIE